MSKLFSRLFTPEDLDRIKAAVHEAERKTSGEIVPYVVDQSDTYDDAEWRGGFFFGVLVLASLVIIHEYTNVWLPITPSEIAIAAILAGIVGMVLLKYIPAVKRAFAGSTLMDKRVSQRAAEAFVAEEVFNTRDRTGILIFLSLFEHKVLVVGDSGINAKVEQSAWEGIVQHILKGMRSGKHVEGLIEAIHACGLLLERHGVAIRPDDRDEISDTLRRG